MGHKDNRMLSLAEESQLLGEASLSTVAFKCRALRKTHELWYFMNHSSIHVPFNFPSSNWYVWSARSAGSKLVSCLRGFFLCLYLTPKALLIETEQADNKVLGRNKQVSTFGRRTTWLWLWDLIWKLRWGWDGQSWLALENWCLHQTHFPAVKELADLLTSTVLAFMRITTLV